VGPGARAHLSLAVQFEELSPVALDQQAQAAKQFAEALAEECGWVDQARARRLWWRFAGDPEEGTKELELGNGGERKGEREEREAVLSIELRNAIAH
jgi:hypothetical protein